jgi:hypothetical protein
VRDLGRSNDSTARDGRPRISQIRSAIAGEPRPTTTANSGFAAAGAQIPDRPVRAASHFCFRVLEGRRSSGRRGCAAGASRRAIRVPIPSIPPTTTRPSSPIQTACASR